MAKKQLVVSIPQRLYKVAVEEAEISNKCMEMNHPEQYHKTTTWQEIVRWHAFISMVGRRKSGTTKYCLQGYTGEGGYPFAFCQECKKQPLLAHK